MRLDRTETDAWLGADDPTGTTDDYPVLSCLYGRDSEEEMTMLNRCMPTLCTLFVLLLATPGADAAEADGGTLLRTAPLLDRANGAYRIAHCCHSHPLPPQDRYCCHRGAYAAPAARYAGSVRRSSRRVARRTARRVGRRR